MLEYDKTDVSEGIDTNKNLASSEVTLKFHLKNIFSWYECKMSKVFLKLSDVKNEKRKFPLFQK